FELATDIRDQKTREKFARNGWRFTSPLQLSVDYWSYRDYIRRSKGEFTVAKDQYVRLNTGWFSDRSGCYLAAGRPVVTQETGFSKFLPTGEGLFGFTTIDQILAALEDICTDYRRHCRAARAIAEEYFDAAKVLDRLLLDAGL